MRISDWSSDVCSSDLQPVWPARLVGRRRIVEHADHPVDDVVDIGKVALHVAVVEHLDRLPLEDRLREDIERHVRTPPGAVNREKPQTCLRKAEQMRIGMAEDRKSTRLNSSH